MGQGKGLEGSSLRPSQLSEGRLAVLGRQLWPCGLRWQWMAKGLLHMLLLQEGCSWLAVLPGRHRKASGEPGASGVSSGSRQGVGLCCPNTATLTLNKSEKQEGKWAGPRPALVGVRFKRALPRVEIHMGRALPEAGLHVCWGPVGHPHVCVSVVSSGSRCVSGSARAGHTCVWALAHDQGLPTRGSLHALHTRHGPVPTQGHSSWELCWA